MAERAEYLFRLADALTARADDLLMLEVADTGNAITAMKATLQPASTGFAISPVSGYRTAGPTIPGSRTTGSTSPFVSPTAWSAGLWPSITRSRWLSMARRATDGRKHGGAESHRSNALCRRRCWARSPATCSRRRAQCRDRRWQRSVALSCAIRASSACPSSDPSAPAWRFSKARPRWRSSPFRLSWAARTRSSCFRMPPSRRLQTRPSGHELHLARPVL